MSEIFRYEQVMVQIRHPWKTTLWKPLGLVMQMHTQTLSPLIRPRSNALNMKQFGRVY